MRPLPTALLLAFTCLCAAQGADPSVLTGAVRFAAGANTRSISLRIPTAPAKGDFFTIITSTRRISATLVLPGGQKVTFRTAESAGLQWHQSPNVRLTNSSTDASTDPGDCNIIEFEKPAVPGTYTVILTSANAPGATARASFTSRMRQYTELVRSAPTARFPAPVPLGREADLIIDVEDTESGVFDIVVPDPAVLVSLTWPDGRVLRRADFNTEMQWGVSQTPGEIPPEARLLEVLNLVPPGEDVHHVIIGRIRRGKYRIHAESNGAPPGQLKASYFSLKDPAIIATLQRTFNPYEPAPGQVHIQPRAFKTVFPGRDMEFRVGLVGDVGSVPPDLNGRVKLILTGSGSRNPQGAADPASDSPIKFSRNADGDYHGTVPIAQVGTARIELRVSGKNSAGEPFHDQTTFDIPVEPIVARIVSLEAKAVDSNNDGFFDRLDVTAQLDVNVPGEYLLSALAVSDTGRASTSGGTATLAAGRQSITASIDAPKVWSLLGDGPYELRVDDISIKRGYSFLNVPDSERVLRTPAYQRSQWSHGSIYGDDFVTVHGIRPTALGRFRAADVEWEVTTPGGHCEWSARVSSIGGSSYFNPSNSAELAPGKSTLSFIVNGAAIAAGRSEWQFDAQVTCGSGPDRLEFPSRTLIIKSDQYEPGSPTLRLEGDNQLRWVSGRSWSADLWAFAKLRVKPGSDVQLEIIGAPEGIDARLAPPSHGGHITAELKVTVAPQVPAGRYFVVVAAKWGQEVITRDLVLDVPPPISGR